MSLVEDGVMAVVVALALKEPFIALAVVVVLLAIGIALVIYLRKWIKLALERRRAQASGRSPSTS